MLGAIVAKNLQGLALFCLSPRCMPDIPPLPSLSSSHRYEVDHCAGATPLSHQSYQDGQESHVASHVARSYVAIHECAGTVIF